MKTNQIIIYQPNNQETILKVRLENETVWLTQAQMSELFQTTRNNVTLHIGNIFKENELKEISVCKDSLLTAKDGKNYKTKIYNLDVIISVGYRVKSKKTALPPVEGIFYNGQIFDAWKFVSDINKDSAKLLLLSKLKVSILNNPML